MTERYDFDFEPDPRASPYGWAAERVRPGSRVLDLGCGNASVLAFLLKEKRCEVLGVDRSPHANLRIPGDRFRAHDLERDRESVVALARSFEPDYVLLLDVLEHLLEPERLLAALGASLPSRARVLVSLPNVASASVVLRLLVDDFSYQESGLLDATHLRFFTEKTARAALARSSLDVVSVSRIERSLAIQEWTAPLASRDQEALARALEQWNAGTRSYQVLLEAAPRQGGAAPVVERALEDGLLSVIVRLHDEKRLPFLDEAIFSLAVSGFPEIEPVVVVQNGSPALLASVEALVASQPWPTKPRARVVPVPVSDGKDGRSRLLNRGIEESRGRYLAFLDDDDVVYQGGYETLVARLRSSGSAVAAGGCRTAVLSRSGERWFTSEKRPFLAPREGSTGLSRIDLFLTNFLPIHTYVIDRARTGAFDLRFDESFSRLEDYELLLRLAASFEIDLARLDTPVAEYRLRRDGSNTVIVPGHGEPSPASVASWEEARARILELKRRLVCLATVPELLSHQAELEHLRARSAALGAVEGKLSFRALMRALAWIDRFPRLKAALRAVIVFPARLRDRARGRPSS
ncbi:methyltransferase domain-containing protein [bacterium]|nr:methyltransferase domain-containing protein [bacterium]